MRIYVGKLGDYLELGEVPSFEYSSILFTYDDLSMSRSVGMTLPATEHNGKVLGFPQIAGSASTVIDSKYDAVLSGEGVQMKGTLYISEVTPEGYDCTFTYGDLSGADSLDTSLDDLLGGYTAADGCVTLASGSATAADEPVTLNSMVCMDYRANIESSGGEQEVGFTDADMRCVTVSNGYFIALGDKEGWYSSNGKSWSVIEDSTIQYYSWQAVCDMDGTAVAIGTNGIIAYCKSSGEPLSWKWVVTVSNTKALNSSGYHAVSGYRNALLIDGGSREMIYLLPGGSYTRVTLPDTVRYVFGAYWDDDSESFNIITMPGTSNGYYVAVYEYDGITLSEISTYPEYAISGDFLPHTVYYKGIRPAGGRLLYVRDASSYIYSLSDAETFARYSVNDIAYDDSSDYYVAVGDDGVTYYGQDGLSSEGGDTGDGALNAVASYGGVTVAVGDGGAFYYTTNHGRSWSSCYAIVSVSSYVAPMPCVNLAWLAYRASAACGYTFELSTAWQSLAPYIYIMLPQCKDDIDGEVADGETVYLRYNLPDVTALDLLLMCAAISGESLYLDGSAIKSFGYDFTGVTAAACDVCEWSSLTHSVTDDGAQSNYITLAEPDSDEDAMASGTGRIWSYATPNETLEEENALYESDLSSGASYQGTLQVSNIELDVDDDGNTTVERSGDATLCWYNPSSKEMKYLADGRLESLIQSAGIDTPQGVSALELIYSEGLTYTVTVLIPLHKFIQLTYDSVIVIEGVAYCVCSADWDDGAAEMTLVRIPKDLL